MSKTLKRLVLAACLSMAGIGGTYVAKRFTSEKSGVSSQGRVIATLQRAVRDVERKPSQRLIWEPVSGGADLFAGETIRTAKDSEAHVEFRDSKTRIDLDPNSEIVIQEVDGKLELNFIKGNLFVAGEGGKDLTLKAGEKNIALGGAELSLSQDGKGKLDVTVVKGDASLASTAQITVSSPLPNEIVYVNPKDRSSVVVDYTPVPAGYVVLFEAGKTREEMRPVEATESAGRMNAQLKPGRLYWRLIARAAGKPDLVSGTFKINVLAKLPPGLLSPDRDAVVALTDHAGRVPFSWTNPSRLDRLQFELFRKGEQTAVLSAPVENGEYSAEIKEPGDYEWRITGYLPGKSEPVSAQSRSFGLVARRELKIPTLTMPRADETIPFANFTEKGLDLKWQPVAGAVGYKVSVLSKKTSETVVEKQAASPVFNLRELKPGEYTWSVRAVGVAGDESKPSNSSTFSLLELQELKWADGKVDANQKYFTEKPTLELAWEKGSDSAAKWRFRLTGERDLAAVVDWTATDATAVTKTIPGDGVYLAEVEALDNRGRVIARSAKRRVTIAAEPLLPAPVFDASIGSALTASNAGTANFAWAPVEGAAEYTIVYETKGSSKESKSSGTTSILKQLMPGQYKVTLHAIDSHGRRSPASEPISMSVPNKSDVRAPRLKKFRID